MISAARIVAVTVMFAIWPVAGMAERPLLAEGRETVYQRVLTRPGAVLYDTAGGQAAKLMPAFQPLYIYQAEPGWYRVGPSASRGSDGWMREEHVVIWKQNIVGAFTNTAGRKRQFLFETEDRLREMMEDANLRARQETLLDAAAAGGLPAGSGIVAVEPENYVNIVDRLYLMPILDFAQDLHPLNYENNLLMQVASVPLREDGAQAGMIADNFDAGIVFVFDTTRSMDPYIARTQKAVERIIGEISGTDIGDRVQFGVIGFRDNDEAAPGLGYRTRILLPLERRQDQGAVIATIRAATDVARASSPGFNEDSLAGVEDAVELMGWEATGGDPFDARIIVLITDAGPKSPSDANARSDIGPAELQRAAEAKGIAVMTLHLQTPAGGPAQHAWAESQYRLLSRYNNETFYYGIPNGSAQSFEQSVARLITALTDVIRVTRNQKPVLDPDQAGRIVNLGLAMQLAYLGRLEGTQAPDVIRGWVSEKAVEAPTRLAIEPRLLVTKNELATMADLLSELLVLGEQSRDAEDAADFFSQVRNVVARMAQNPDRLLAPGADTLGGALEFLRDLPYESQLMLTTETRWRQSAMIRRQILDGMRQKLVQYRKWLLDPTVWTALYDRAPDGEHVFAMPFDVLP